jgi:hypothetical protein
VTRPSYVLTFAIAAFLTGAAFVFKYHVLGEAPADEELFRRLLAGALFVIAILVFRLGGAYLRGR